MKSIKLAEQAEIDKKEPKISKLPVKAKQDIEEEMPLKIKGRSGGKPRRSVAKEAEPSAVLPPTPPTKSPDKIGMAFKKDAVFFK